MFCAGLLLSIADLLNCVDCDFPTAGPQRDGQAQSNSMFLEAFPLLQEQGGTIPLDLDLQGRPSQWGRCQYHTAIRGAFQPKVAGKRCLS